MVVYVSRVMSGESLATNHSQQEQLTVCLDQKEHKRTTQVKIRRVDFGMTIHTNMKLQKTNNYNQFKFIDTNRELYHPHVENLVKSIGRRNLLRYIPILVDKNMKVLDGQHRLMAAKKLGVDVHYLVIDDLTMEDIILLNVNHRRWGTVDYLNYYLKQGLKDYQILADFSKKHGVSPRLSMIVLSSGYGSDSSYAVFKSGLFKVIDLEKAEDVISKLFAIRRFMEVTSLNDRELVQATRTIVKKGYFAQLIENIQESGVKVVRSNSTREYLRQFELFLNRRKRGQIIRLI